MSPTSCLLSWLRAIWGLTLAIRSCKWSQILWTELRTLFCAQLLSGNIPEISLDSGGKENDTLSLANNLNLQAECLVDEEFITLPPNLLTCLSQSGLSSPWEEKGNQCLETRIYSLSQERTRATLVSELWVVPHWLQNIVSWLGYNYGCQKSHHWTHLEMTFNNS